MKVSDLIFRLRQCLEHAGDVDAVIMEEDEQQFRTRAIIDVAALTIQDEENEKRLNIIALKPEQETE